MNMSFTWNSVRIALLLILALFALGKVLILSTCNSSFSPVSTALSPTRFPSSWNLSIAPVISEDRLTQAAAAAASSSSNLSIAPFISEARLTQAAAAAASAGEGGRLLKEAGRPLPPTLMELVADIRFAFHELHKHALAAREEDWDLAVRRLASAGGRVPRWALLVALGKEREGISALTHSGGQGGQQVWSRRAACLYSMAMSAFPKWARRTASWTEVFSHAALVVEKARQSATAAASSVAPISQHEAQGWQDRQCGGTHGEATRWKGDSKPLLEFARKSQFHPSNWPKYEPHQRTQMLRHVIKTHWGGFSPGAISPPPSREQTGTDLREIFGKDWEPWFRSLMQACTLSVRRQQCDGAKEVLVEEEHDVLKAQANQMHLTLNAHAYPAPQGLPIWIRVRVRTSPLNEVLEGLRRVRGAEDSVLVVTVDGDSIEGVIREILKIDFMQVRIYFHPFTITRDGLGFQEDSNMHRINAHFTYGLRITLVEMLYDYVATLEDDLVPAPGFLAYHEDMRPGALENDAVIAVLSYPSGDWHDCNAIADALQGRGQCRGDDHSALYTSGYFAGWGSGLTIKALEAYMPAWNYMGTIYDGIILGISIANDWYALSTCTPKVRLLPNQGVNGDAGDRWDSAWRVESKPEQNFAMYRVVGGDPNARAPQPGSASNQLIALYAAEGLEQQGLCA